jgi:hypothetical protein
MARRVVVTVVFLAVGRIEAQGHVSFAAILV